MEMMFQITSEPIQPDTLRKAVMDHRSGGFASFEGWVRNHHEGKLVESLEYSAYVELAEKEGDRIVQRACDEFDIIGARCEHRIGHLAIGDIAVCVAVSAAHRDAAFAACRFIIDEIKHTVPIWKKEHYTDQSAAWPSCKGCTHPEHHH